MTTLLPMAPVPGVDLPVAPEDIPALQDEVRALAAERGAVILAHNYQLPEVQDVADYVGDSLGLSRQGAATDKDVIAFCGVHFMAETASILSPDKRVLIPDLPLQVECRTLDEVDEALAAGATRILLDNMDPAALRAAVERIGGRAEAEGSGGMDLATVRAAAEAGLDSISVGALTHSAPVLDLSLLLEPLP